MLRGYSEGGGRGHMLVLKPRTHRVTPTTGRLNHGTENGDQRAGMDWNDGPDREWTGYSDPRGDRAILDEILRSLHRPARERLV